MPDLYMCDPALNTSCLKTMCHLNGGPCECTSNKQYAKELTPLYKLDDMMYKQQVFQERLGANFSSMTTRDRIVFIKEHSIHLNQEINEMLYELPYFKPWKDYTNITEQDEQEAIQKACMECIDAWHFFMNIMLALGFSPKSFHEMYVAKNKENHRRQDAGYTADVSYRNQSVEEVLFDEQD